MDAFPLNPAAWKDTDGDGKPDAYDPNATQAQIDASSLMVDTDDDNDNIPDDVEAANGLHPLNDLDASVDADGDGDGLSNFEESELGTGIQTAATNGDGINDKDEVGAGSNPLVNELGLNLDLEFSIVVRLTERRAAEESGLDGGRLLVRPNRLIGPD